MSRNLRGGAGKGFAFDFGDDDESDVKDSPEKID
jgi:hypothetical protein